MQFTLNYIAVMEALKTWFGIAKLFVQMNKDDLNDIHVIRGSLW